MCWDLSERRLILRLRVARYGATGFCCVHCSCTEGLEVANRPRIQRCKDCRRDQSVTAGTVMHATKLPMRAWFLRGGYFECGRVPTSGQLVADFDMARSTAWHLNQRFMRALHLGRATWAIGQLVMILPCRRPKGRDTDTERPRLLRQLLQNFASQPLGAKYPTVISLTFDGLLPRWTHVAMDHEQYHEARKNLLFQSSVVTEPLENWLQFQIVDRHGKVCLRWMSRWIDHYLGIWGQTSDLVKRPDWLHRLTHGPHRGMAELRAEPHEPGTLLLPRYAT
ncbi:MAG: hypothetical protein H6738_12415 [Alphaproteobacteria bacterium]|nr:hypothetical protein [Alphaproteobacteria bacterium]